MTSAATAQVADRLVQAARDVELAHLESAVLPERQLEPAGDLNLPEPQPLTIAGKVLNDDGEHGSG